MTPLGRKRERRSKREGERCVWHRQKRNFPWSREMVLLWFWSGVFTPSGSTGRPVSITPFSEYENFISRRKQKNKVNAAGSPSEKKVLLSDTVRDDKKQARRREGSEKYNRPRKNGRRKSWLHKNIFCEFRRDELLIINSNACRVANEKTQWARKADIRWKEPRLAAATRWRWSLISRLSIHGCISLSLYKHIY